MKLYNLSIESKMGKIFKQREGARPRLKFICEGLGPEPKKKGGKEQF